MKNTPIYSIITPKYVFLLKAVYKMKSVYHSDLSRFVREGNLPLWVVFRDKGDHPERFFHDHNYSEIAIITGGEAWHLADERKAPLSTGDILIIHPGMIHAYAKTGNMSIVNLIFDRSRLTMPMLDGYSLALFKKIFPEDNENHLSVEPVMHLEQDDLHTLLTMLEKIDDELKSIQPGCQLGALALFLEVLVFLSRKYGSDSARQQARFMIGDALRYMNQHYMEVIKVETLARKAKMSVRSFTRHFPEAVGCSPIDYLIKIRLQHAMDQLINTDLSIGEIAINCGFYDSNYFCKKFRQNFHESPRRFRQKSLAGERI